MTQPKILYSFIEGQQRFSCNGIEIVNPEMLDNIQFANGSYRQIIVGELFILKHGDTFDLPNGLKLREENVNCKYCESTGKYEIRFDKIIKCDYCKGKKVFRIVKTEVKPEPESQEELWEDFRKRFIIEGLEASRHFTIQRKKP